MKSTLALILIVTLLAFTTDSIAGERGYFAKDNEELYGTWINMDYSGSPPQIIFFNPDGTGAHSYSVKVDPAYKSKYLVTGKWTDQKGNIMYKTHWVGNWKAEGYSLIKISNSGTTLELVFDQNESPKEIDSDHVFYRKYTRK